MTHISLLIIGAGPTGLSCGIAAQQANIDYKIIEKGCLVNSIHDFPTDMTFFSSSNNLEIGGVPFTSLSLRPSKREALEYYRRIAEHFKLNIGLYEPFKSIERSEDSSSKGRFKVVTSKEEYTCDFIVNSTGFYDIPVLMDVPGEELEKVKHYFTSAHHLYNQRVAVVGASNSAVDVALEAYRKGAAEVSLFVRKKEVSSSVKYWVKPDLEGRIAEGSIKAYYESDIVEITDRHIIFKYQNEIHQLENDFVYAMTGYQPNFTLARHLGIDIDRSAGKPVYNEDTMETNALGVYLAGVVCGGLNTRKWFIENTRDHGDKIMRHIKENYGLK